MATGAVNVYGIIDKEGKVQNVQVLSSDADVQKDVREALKKWRFSPAMCGSTPVATEREMQIPFFDFGGQGGGPRSR
jgi:TonB family protein